MRLTISAHVIFQHRLEICLGRQHFEADLGEGAGRGGRGGMASSVMCLCKIVTIAKMMDEMAVRREPFCIKTSTTRQALSL
jgi:hypothetical protein